MTICGNWLYGIVLSMIYLITVNYCTVLGVHCSLNQLKSTDLLATMEVLGTDKQFSADDDVEAYLDHDWNEKEQSEFDHLESSRPDSSARSAERKHA